MKVLITGMDGFIGQALRRRLLQAGHEVVGLSVGPLAGTMPGLHRCDTTDPVGLDRVFARESPSVCVHLAGLAHADLRPEDEPRVRAVNVDGTLHVGRAAAEAGVKQLFFFSSAKVYCDVTGREGVDEEEAPAPADIYGRLKLEAEERLLDLGRASGLAVTCIRPVAVFGPGDSRGNYARLIWAIRRGFFLLVDGGRARRSIVSLDRLVSRMERMIAGPPPAHSRYVFADGTFTLAEIMNAMRCATGPAFFLPVSRTCARRGGRVADFLYQTVTCRPGPVGKALERLCESFVIRPHYFDEDFGPLPPFDLASAMKDAVAPHADDSNVGLS